MQLFLIPSSKTLVMAENCFKVLHFTSEEFIRVSVFYDWWQLFQFDDTVDFDDLCLLEDSHNRQDVNNDITVFKKKELL